MNKVRFTEEQATMLGTLYGRVLDNRRNHPVLGDRAAEDAMSRIDYDFDRLGVDDDIALSIAARAKVIDDWATQYLRTHPDTTVLHLGCGLDTRVDRLDPAASVHWYDVDFPEVIALRRRVYPDRANYSTVATSVTELEWLDTIPTHRPTLIIAEGLTMYLEPAAGAALLRRIVELFPAGQLICDVYGRLGVRWQKANPVVRKTGATLRWGIDDPAEFEPYGLRPISHIDTATWADRDGLGRPFADASLALRLQLALIRYLPPLHRLARIGRWEF